MGSALDVDLIRGGRLEIRLLSGDCGAVPSGYERPGNVCSALNRKRLRALGGSEAQTGWYKSVRSYRSLRLSHSHLRHLNNNKA